MAKERRAGKDRRAGHGSDISRRPAAPVGRMPTREEIVRYLENAQGKVGKREIAKAFGIKGGDRIELKSLLADLAAEGAIVGNRKHLKRHGQVPSVAVLEIIDRDEEGELVAEPVTWEEDAGPRPRILVMSPRGRHRDADMAMGPGDRILARVTRLDVQDTDGYAHEAEPIKRLPREKRRLLGIFRAGARGGGSIDPVDRRDLKTWPVRAGGEGEAKDGDLVRFDIAGRHRGGLPEARVAETLGNPKDQRQISLIAVHAYGIPDEFPEVVRREAEELPKLDTLGRGDLTALPLLTIDPVDARDHDDAVCATPDTDPRNEGGYIVTVAIADVASYVKPGTRLDREAELRGNSVYFPDRVVPMLPERISNDLCSLREGELRPCMAVTMTFDRNGAKRRHIFQRGLMRSAAKLSYEDAQAAFDGKPGEKAAPLMQRALEPLWAAYQCLKRGRDARGPLDLDLPERKIVMDGAGHVARIVIPERLEAHRLIEEMMIQANVAAAETLEQQRTPCVYRVHDRPSKEKLAALGEFLESLEIKLPKGEGLRPSELNRILAQARSLPAGDLVNEVVLRAQAQAEYAIANIGHFGLHLQRYAHFTSPIRRYADLLVHRALIRALKLGDDGLPKEAEPRLTDVAKAISDAERRAMSAERETSDRLLAAYLADRIGADFPARISGVTRSGLFVRLRDTGADGFVPISTIGRDYWHHDESQHALIGERTGVGYRLGDTVEVRLVEAIPAAGALRFEILTEGRALQRAGRKSRPLPGRLGRGRSRRR
ncbi:MAG: ribonuclease R [Hyphomicrobiaceae bacterium]|nr:ribonuclease R [Hyphomicrobiaceae bacterium]